MCALYPRTDELPGVVDTDVDEFLQKYKRESSGIMWLGLVAGSAVFAASPLFTVFAPVPSFMLPKGMLDEHAMKITYSPVYLVRQSVFVVKLAAGMCWGQDPEVRAKMAMEPYPADPGTVREGDA